MNTIIIVNTYSQLIIAIQMRNTLFYCDSVSVIMTDFAKDSFRYSMNLEKERVFDAIYYLEKKKYCAEPISAFEKIASVGHIVFGNKVFKRIKEKKWDRLCFYNTDTATYSLYVSLVKRNPKLECFKFEEGILSYSCPFSNNMRYRIAEKYLSLHGIKSLENATKTFLCFYPNQYTGKLVAKRIPKIDVGNPDILTVIKRVFEIDVEKNNRIYDKKFIYFSGVYDFEGGSPIGELSLVERISDMVGKENLIVKVHPRDDVNRFLKRGLTVAESSNVPWEAIQMTSKLDGATFLTVSSGSVLFINLLINHPIKSIFLFPQCDLSKNKTALRNANDISNILENGVEGHELPWIHIIKDDLNSILE